MRIDQEEDGGGDQVRLVKALKVLAPHRRQRRYNDGSHDGGEHKSRHSRLRPAAKAGGPANALVPGGQTCDEVKNGVNNRRARNDVPNGHVGGGHGLVKGQEDGQGGAPQPGEELAARQEEDELHVEVEREAKAPCNPVLRKTEGGTSRAS